MWKSCELKEIGAQLVDQIQRAGELQAQRTFLRLRQDLFLIILVTAYDTTYGHSFIVTIDVEKA